ncbi:hypothetical protein [Actinomadura hibisca]|uniref:hypothetical protein n=1 Tax=Actinomadura hibisca TaxID=68565 RepID=UPI00082A7AFE|nr:hypothetical protein [Actinomadura hibisca]
MSNDVEHLRTLLADHDPARDVRADDAQVEQALRAVTAAPDPRGRAVRTTWRRRLLVGVPVTIVATAAVTGLTLVRPDGDGPARVGTAQALAFTERGDHLEVRVLDPDADPQTYRKQFAAHRLNVELRVAPVSPSLVGKMLAYDERTTARPRVTPLEGDRTCGEISCYPGVRIPSGLRNRVDLLFGRAAKPGERYEIGGDAAAAGEPLAGVALKGRKVGEVRRLAGQRGVTIVKYRRTPSDCGTGDRCDPQPQERPLESGQVPDSWYVHGALTGRSRTEVSLDVASRRTPDE